ncbi:MAG: response regulator [Gemmatimonadaceae bacterium]
MSDADRPRRDALTARLLTTFATELDDSHRALVADALALERDPSDAECQRSVSRIMHTLKGAARAAGVPAIETLCHAMEGHLSRAKSTGTEFDATQLSLLLAIADAFADAAQQLRRGEEVPESAVAALIHRMSGRGSWSPPTDLVPTVPPSVARAEPEPPPRPETDEPHVADEIEEANKAPEPEEAQSAPLMDRDDQVRVGVASLESLLASTGELLRLAAAMEEQPTILMRAAREIDNPAVRSIVTKTTRRFDSDVRALHTLSARLIDSVRRLRQRPFSEIVEALPRAVRDIAVSVGKPATLVIDGGEVEADRPVLELLREPLLHLVRNAVDHGLESPEERRVAGKPEEGTVTVRASLRSDRLRVTVTDDGRGLDLEKLRARLIDCGLPVPPDTRGLADTIFDEGLSTRDEVTEISGRGVGLRIVRTAVESIGGLVHVTWKPGRGTTFIMEVPVTVAVIRAIIADVGGHPVAIPTTYVERVSRIRREEIRFMDGATVLEGEEMPIPLVSLASRLGPPFTDLQPDPDSMMALRIEAGERQLAIVVTDVLDEREVVLRPLDAGVNARRALLAGATLLPDGTVALVLDVNALLARRGESGATSASINFAPARPVARNRILVVDDSITTRTLEESVLSASGYEVETAVDGEEAWEMLQQGQWDLVVSDIEMPRMSGLELCRKVRATSATEAIPVVLVTSLDLPEEKMRGLDAGADAYITKSSFDQDTLLDTIRQLIGRGEGEAS